MAQVTIAFVLLIGAGLLAASFRQALRLDPGFTPSGVMTGAISLPSTSYKDDRVLPFVTGAFGCTKVRAKLPCIEHAGVTTIVPLAGDHHDSVILAEGYQMKPGESLISPLAITVSDGYFEVLGTRLVKGRFFEPSDDAKHPTVVVVDDRLANHFWRGQDPIGRRLYYPGSADKLFTIGPDTKWLTVVGVVREVQFDGVATAAQPVGTVYAAFAQSQSPERGFGLVVKSTLDSSATVSSIRRTVASLNSSLPFYSVKSMDDYLDRALLPRRVPMLLASGFALVALMLAAVGIYGGARPRRVAQRHREIGIRLALGSTSREIFGLILREGLTIVLPGLLFGFAGLVSLRHALTTSALRRDAARRVSPDALHGALLAVALIAMPSWRVGPRRLALRSP